MVEARGALLLGALGLRCRSPARPTNAGPRRRCSRSGPLGLRGLADYRQAAKVAACGHAGQASTTDASESARPVGAGWPTQPQPCAHSSQLAPLASSTRCAWPEQRTQARSPGRPIGTTAHASRVASVASGPLAIHRWARPAARGRGCGRACQPRVVAGPAQRTQHAAASRRSGPGGSAAPGIRVPARARARACAASRSRSLAGLASGCREQAQSSVTRASRKSRAFSPLMTRSRSRPRSGRGRLGAAWRSSCSGLAAGSWSWSCSCAACRAACLSCGPAIRARPAPRTKRQGSASPA